MNPITLPTRANSSVIEAAYAEWLDNPDSVDATWRAFFQGFALGNAGTPIAQAAATGIRVIDSYKQAQVGRYINAHRSHGHLQAHVDPLNPPPPEHPKLTLTYFDLEEADLDESFTLTNYKGGGQMRLRAISEALKETYCGHIGVEYMHVQDHDAREWIQVRMEACNNRPAFNRDQKKRILSRIHKAETFEKFLQARFVGQKRFSLEGGETMIAAFDAMLEKAPELGVEEFVVGMAHRGRLSLIANVMRKPFDLLFEQFSENYIPESVSGDGDVKYHLGYDSVLKTTSGAEVEVRLSANPSHLEIVNPVVEGRTRARQRRRNDTADRRRVCPFLIHGDAAFAGQGVIAETLNFSQLPGYRTGGTIHFVINNQIGFTTQPADARSTRYCTDVVKMIEAPVFHVNGDDPEAVCYAIQLALEFRVKFQRDIVIDMYCYRKHGHNEADEPAFTQPLLYKKIAVHPLVSSIYTERLIAEGSFTQAESDEIKQGYEIAMDASFEKARKAEADRKAAGEKGNPFRGSTAIFQPDYSHDAVQTGVPLDVLQTITDKTTSIPEDFHINPKIKRLLDHNAKVFASGGPVDWGFGERLAFGSLLLEGTPVRLSGQDCERGTFSHRHAAVYDMENRNRYVPLLNLGKDQAKFCVYNSLLSEAAVLGFDYGYSLDYHEMLCIWEAQFGDFANGAQVIIDQFLSSSESKWQRMSGMVLLLPHGYEGQGPEHSSARLERFLQLCAEDNMQVANLTTPANYFHILRRQMKRDYRKPLIIMSPKSLLRHHSAVSPVEAFTSGSFQEIIPDPEAPKKIDRLILCSGKVYYDLNDYRTSKEVANTSIVRIEQLYPLHTEQLEKIANTLDKKAALVWAQEEPKNMGAWNFIVHQLEEVFGRRPVYAGREAAASPAVGTLAMHKRELAAFLEQAFTL